MGHEQRGEVSCTPQFEKEVVEPFAKHFVHRREWFIKENQIRSVNKRSSNGDAHLHPSRQLPRQLVVHVVESDVAKHCIDCTIVRRTAKIQWEGDVSADGTPRQESWLLEDDANAFRRGVHCSDGRLHESCDEAQQG